ncbi:MAG: 23S ribosomal RNA methyltransferase Erm [Candidatus Dojkabacteria bacterium]|nr:23S ribosomal RNA methyltransferase Erm [Candidatus Dojkabacteria bacterium]
MNEHFSMDRGNSNSKGESLWHSQNFLRDPQFVASLVDIADISSHDTVIEIGPGKGIITEQLSRKADRVIAIEYDNELVQGLREKFSDSSNVEILGADFLKWSLPNNKYKVFSNIPFEYTSRIIDKLLVSSNPPEDTFLIMQDLAAKRFMGKFAGGEDSQMSILLQPFYSMNILRRIDRNQYTPTPNVNTVLGHFMKKEYPLIENKNTQEYRDFVIYGYNQWKPTLLEAFKDVFSYNQTKIIKKNLKLEGKKPSDLDVNTWVALFKTYQKYVPQERKFQVKGSEERLNKSQQRMKKRYRTRK